MAFARLASAPSETETHVTLLYARAAGAELSVLDARLQAIVDRYKPHVELKTVAPDQLSDYTDLDCPTPAVVVLRRGAVVGQALGALLPFRAIDDVVRCAVEWPEAVA